MALIVCVTIATLTRQLCNMTMMPKQRAASKEDVERFAFLVTVIEIPERPKNSAKAYAVESER